jgi:hypothetical protein
MDRWVNVVTEVLSWSPFDFFMLTASFSFTL